MSSDEQLTCKEVVELVTDYLENALLPQTRTSVDAHLADCPGCTTYLEQVQKTIGLLRTLTEQPVLPSNKQELLRIFRDLKQEEAH
jgi:predicted anti-sigma-YlaC factor YlaD